MVRPDTNPSSLPSEIDPTGRSPLNPWPLYDVTVDGFPSYTVTAQSRGKALARALEDYRNYRDDVGMKEFMRLARVRMRSEPVAFDGYDYVRRAYDVHPIIGQQGELINEGPETGRRVVVLYPNRSSTAYVHVAYECGANVVVHPMNIRLFPVGSEPDGSAERVAPVQLREAI